MFNTVPLAHSLTYLLTYLFKPSTHLHTQCNTIILNTLIKSMVRIVTV
jgi:hypothetical protein